MHIFVSWSGRPAQILADFLQIWLRQVIQELDPFMSTNSIDKGARWSPEIAKRLEETSQAIVIVTSDNQDAPWLNFEAGALAKATDSRVRPLLIDLAPSDVTGPLSEFQLTAASDKEDVRRLLNSINESCERSLPGTLLDKTFDREWPAFEQKVGEVVELIGGQPGAKQRKRSDPDLLAEVLERVRSVERLSQDQLYLSEQLFSQLSGPPTRYPQNRNTRTSTKDRLQNLFEFLNSAGAERLRITGRNGDVLEGQVLQINYELPDTEVVIGDVKNGPAGTMQLVSIERIEPFGSPPDSTWISV